MISFSLLTQTPAVLRNQLIARGILQTITQEGQQVLVGVNEGVEWVEVPNPIVTTAAVGNPRLPDNTPNPDYVPPVMDSRHCYLVKLVRTAENSEEQGLPQDGTDLTTRTKLGQWIKANSVPETITSADGRSWPSLRVGTNFWLVNSDDFGVWQ